MRMMAMIATPANTPTTIPAIAPPLRPLLPLEPLPTAERLFASVELDGDGSLAIDVVVMYTVCGCWLEPVDTEVVTIWVVY